MRTTLLLFLCATLAIVPGPSAGDDRGASGGVPPPALCRALTVHVPAPLVAFDPGRDVRGRRLPPADLPGSAGAASLEGPAPPVAVRLTVPLAARLGRDLPDGASEVELGLLTVSDGVARLDGVDLPADAAARLAALCALGDRQDAPTEP